MLTQHENLYIPADERTLQRLQRRVNELDKRARDWAQLLVSVLPRGISLLPEESDLLRLFLAQQRRRNAEMDIQNGVQTARSRLGRILPFIGDEQAELDMAQAAHRMVATRLESDIDRATDFFCRDRSLPGLLEPVLDWRVAIRYMAQRLHHVACHMNLKRDLTTSPLRFELALTARDLAGDVLDKRRRMLAIIEPAHVT